MKSVKQKKLIYDIIPPQASIMKKAVVQTSRGVMRTAISLQKKALAIFVAVLVVLTNAQAFVAFEAHVVDVKAEIARVDAPLITPPSGDYPSEITVNINADDPDATHVFYAVTPGLDVNVADDPDCGGLYMGGPKPIAGFPIAADVVVKAVACQGVGEGAHGSLISYAVYDPPHLYAGIQGHKYHDTNKNEQFDAGDFAIEGWAMYLVDKNEVTASTTVTDASGFYYFKGVPPGQYTIKEEKRSGWLNVTPPDFPVTIEGDEAEVFDFYNFDTGFMCLPKDVFFPAGLAVQASGDGSENNDDIALGASVSIFGDARSNDDIRRMNNAASVSIFGSATSSSDVDNGINVSKHVLEGAAAASLPDVMISEWKMRAADGGTVNGSFIFPDNTTGIALGPSDISGKIKFGKFNTATIKGPLYIHGDLKIGENTVITADPAFSDQFLPIVVDGVIDIEHGASFVGAGAKGAFLLISTHAAVDLDDAAIEATSGASDVGDAVLYASEGDIHVRSGRTILTAFAAHGTGVDGDHDAAVRLDSNVTVAYRELPGMISCGARQPYESTLHVVINEFMPNPVGLDNAAKPGGEWVEIFNPTSDPVDMAGWYLYDNSNSHELPILASNTNTGGTSVASGEFLVVYRNGDSDFELNNSGDSVRLFTAEIASGGFLVDSKTYTISAEDNKSYVRVPDGSPNWIDPEATPGDFTNVFVEGPDGEVLEEGTMFIPAAKPVLYIRPKLPEELPPEENKPQALEEDSKETIMEEKGKVEEPSLVEVPEDADDLGGDGNNDAVATSTVDGVAAAEAGTISETGDVAVSENSTAPEDASAASEPEDAADTSLIEEQPETEAVAESEPSAIEPVLASEPSAVAEDAKQEDVPSSAVAAPQEAESTQEQN